VISFPCRLVAESKKQNLVDCSRCDVWRRIFFGRRVYSRDRLSALLFE
jgi:hypothetical protein